MLSKQMESTAVGIAGTIQPSALLQGEIVIPKAIEGSGEGATASDWNAKEGEPGHILNRTHWSEGESTAEVFPVADLLFSENEGAALSSIVVEGLVNGDKVVVTYNGVEYNCIVVEKSMDGLPVRVVGDADVMESGPSGTYPFMAMFLDAGTAAAGANGVGTYVLPLDGATSVSFGIKKTTENIRKLDNKYLDLAWLPTAKVTLTAVMSEITVDTTSRVPVLVRDLPIEALPVGTKVIVTFDGVEYKCNIIEVGGIRCFGNPFLLGNPTGAGEPFFFSNEENAWRIWTSERAPHTVAITEEKRVYNKIPEEFLGKTANWSQNDPNGTGYIENRTHWSENVAEVDILPECELIAPDPENLDGWFDVDKEMGEIIAGKTYTVTHNGTDYTLIAQEIVTEGELCCALGDIGLWDDAPTGDLPFLLVCLPRYYALETGLYALFVDSNCPASVALRVRGESETIKHLDSKYIQDMYGWEQDVTLLPRVELSDIPEHGVTGVRDPNGTIGYVSLRKGAEYKVIYNNILYICTAKDPPVTPSLNGYVAMLGNGRRYGLEDTGEPFMLLFKESVDPGYTNINVHVLDGSEWALLSIRGPGVKKVPSEYLPNFVNPSVYANDMGWLQEQVDTNKSNVSDLFSNVNDLNSEVFSLRSRINSVENTNRAQNTDISALQQKVDTTAVDWNAREGEPGHILNRTHWSEGITEVEVLPVTALQFDENEGAAFGTTVVEGLTDGDEATVTYNGVEYTCVVKEIDEDGMRAWAVGDVDVMTSGPSGAYPFAAMIPGADAAAVMGGIGVYVIPLDGATSVSFGIKKSSENIHKLDNKYLALDWLPAKKVSDVEILPTTEIQITASLQKNIEEMPSSSCPVNSVAKVVFDGVEYGCKVVAYGNARYFGNLSVYAGDNAQNTGEPFVFMIGGTGTVWVMAVKEKGVYRVSVKEEEVTYNKIPEEFLDKDAIVSAVISALPKYNGEVVEV